MYAQDSNAALFNNRNRSDSSEGAEGFGENMKTFKVYLIVR